jgi:sulfur carrier protein
MRITVNGESQICDGPMTVVQLLVSLKIDPTTARGIAVALDDRIVRKPEWADKQIIEGARVEIVTAQQGG